MKKTVLIVLSVAISLALGGCAKTHLQRSGKLILATQASADAALTSADALCDSGTLSTAQCRKIKDLSDRIRAAYNTVADAYLVAATASDANATTAQAKYESAKNSLDTLVADLSTTLTALGVPTTGSDDAANP